MFYKGVLLVFNLLQILTSVATVYKLFAYDGSVWGRMVYREKESELNVQI